MPQEKQKQAENSYCERCGSAYVKSRSSQKFCKEPACAARRDQERRQKWREGKAAENDWGTPYAYQQDWALRKKYGITLNEWLAMVDAADGKCEICGEAEDTLCVDHDHDTGQVRGVLCRKCNRSIGQLGDTAEHLRAALRYLERSN